MKIASANLQMASTHTALQQRETKESMRISVGQQRPNFQASNPGPIIDPVNISQAGKSAQSADEIKKELDEAVDRDPGLNLIRQMLAFLSGEKIKISDVADLDASFAQTQSPAASSPLAQQSAGFGIAYSRSESYTESEQTSFSANGTVKTTDGKEISFSLELSMARSYHEESSVSVHLGDAAKQVDPLILNFSGTAAQLANQRFSFDLNADGQQEQINSLQQGSGFLVFDRNNDGKINNGQEMFGPSSGNGFAELKSFDDDSNGWIDENDSAYSRLQIWQGTESGQGALQSLSTAGVGAIALNHLSTLFSIKDSTNQLMGQVRNSGIFLQHNGEAGTIQHVDLTV